MYVRMYVSIAHHLRGRNGPSLQPGEAPCSSVTVAAPARRIGRTAMQKVAFFCVYIVFLKIVSS